MKTTQKILHKPIYRKAKSSPWYQRSLSGGYIESINLYTGVSTSISVDYKGTPLQELHTTIEWEEITEVQYNRARSMAIAKIMLIPNYSLPDDELNLMCPYCKSRNVKEVKVTHGEAYCEDCDTTMDIAKCIDKMDYETAHCI